MLDFVLIYTLVIAFLMVSTIPTFSGKLLGERISREYVLPIFILAIGFVALLVTYPYGTLTGASIAYLALDPVQLPALWAHDGGDRGRSSGPISLRGDGYRARARRRDPLRRAAALADPLDLPISSAAGAA